MKPVLPTKWVSLGSRRRAALFIGPALLLIFAVSLYPLLRSVYLGFTNRLFTYSHYSFTGLENYARMVNDPLFWHALLNSVKLSFWNVSGSLVLGLFLALLLNSSGRLMGFFRSIFFLPWAVPSVVIALMFRWLYNDMYGYLNHILLKLGVISQSFNLLAGTETAWLGVILPMVWCYYPFVMLVFISALRSIDPRLYEAAAIDGASRWHAFRYITMPALKQAIFVVTILEIIWSFAAFDLVYLLTGGGPANATLTLSVYIYKQGFFSKYLGYASALGTMMLIILLLFTALYFKVINKSKLYEET